VSNRRDPSGRQASQSAQGSRRPSQSQRRHQRALAAERVAARARRRRRIRRVVALVLAVALAATGAVVLVRRYREPSVSREGSTLVAGNTGPLAMKTPPLAYHIDYRVSDLAGPKRIVNTDRIWIRRPFESRVETFSGSSPGAKALSVQVTQPGLMMFSPADASPTITGSPISLASADVRFDVILEQALATRGLQQRERRRVLGRLCQVYRSGSVIGSGSLTPYKRGANEYSDTCVDAEGLALEEIWVFNHKVLRRKVAVAVDTNSAFTDETFKIPSEITIPVESGGGVTKLGDSSTNPPGATFTVEEPPGFARMGRYTVIYPQAGGQSGLAGLAQRTISVVEVWRRGAIDFVAVEVGRPQEGMGTFSSGRIVKKADLGSVGKGQTAMDLRTSEVRVPLEGDRFLKVYGTLTPTELAAITRGVRVTPNPPAEIPAPIPTTSPTPTSE